MENLGVNEEFRRILLRKRFVIYAFRRINQAGHGRVKAIERRLRRLSDRLTAWAPTWEQRHGFRHDMDEEAERG